MRLHKDGRFCGRIFFKRWQLEYVFGKFRFSIGYSPYEHHTIRLVFPLIGLYISWGHAKYDRQVTISIHNWAIWWALWADTMGWSNKTSKWRKGCWHFLDTLLGKIKYTREIIKERDVEIPMPEGTYPAHIKLCKDVWKRPRWFANIITRIDADIPKGIPHEGKGENSWDCGISGCFGMCCSARNIEEGVGKIVGSVLHDRVRYGGWNDWKWTKSLTK